MILSENHKRQVKPQFGASL